MISSYFLYFSAKTKQFNKNPENLTNINIDMSKSENNRIECPPKSIVMSDVPVFPISEN